MRKALIFLITLGIISIVHFIFLRRRSIRRKMRRFVSGRWRCWESGKRRRSVKRSCSAGLEKARWEARMEEILPEVYLDGAHNPDGIAAFLKSVQADGGGGGRILLYSSLAEKACGGNGEGNNKRRCISGDCGHRDREQPGGEAAGAGSTVRGEGCSCY